MRHQVWTINREDISMTRSIRVIFLATLFILMLYGSAAAQDFVIRVSDDAVVAASRENQATINVFEDTNGDNVYDALTINGNRISGTMRINEAEGFQYEDGRSIVIYPAVHSGLPEPGTSAILGFIHYFDDEYLSTYLAVVAEQIPDDDTTNGLGVYFYDSAGLRVGAPSTMFMEKARLRPIPIYQEWVQMGKDFGIGSNPINSQFFVIAKDLGLTDHVLIVMFQLYQ